MRKLITFLVLCTACVFTPKLFAQQEPSERKVCQHQAPEAGELLVCDKDCNCQILGPKKESAKIEPKEAKADACGILLEHIVAPVYPAIAIANRIGGNVFIQVEIQDDGGVKTAQVIEGHPMLARGALEAVKRWKFSAQCSRIQMVSVRYRMTGSPLTDPPGVVINPPDDVEIVAEPMIMDTTDSLVAKKKSSTKKKTMKKPAKK